VKKASEVRTKALISNPVVADVKPIEIDCSLDTGAAMLMLASQVKHSLPKPIYG